MNDGSTPNAAVLFSAGDAAGDGMRRSFGNSIRICFHKYAVFTGRAPRAEYWWFILFIDLVELPLFAVLAVAIGLSAASTVMNLVGLVFLLPGIAVSIRRLHDRDKSGWWVLLALIPIIGGIILVVWLCMRGTHGPNRFGPENGAVD